MAAGDFKAYADMIDATLFHCLTRLVFEFEFEFEFVIADEMRAAIPENRFNDWCSARAPAVIELLLLLLLLRCLWFFLFLIPPPLATTGNAGTTGTACAFIFDAADAKVFDTFDALECRFKLDPSIASTFWNMRQIRRVVPIPGIRLNALSTMSIDALAAPLIPDTTVSRIFSIDPFNLSVRASTLPAYSSSFALGLLKSMMPIIFNNPIIVIGGDSSSDDVENNDLTKFIIAVIGTQKD